ncbi:dTDP-4-dehydrorhamnose reductase [Psychromonas sp. KJ10-10]|uniref:dTDP-4-dehydrorhamnose reductase n=1 Tax=Psychromonas sp. KJ10-10 TaxID=3391823 RepID=UPI0039B4ED5D
MKVLITGKGGQLAWELEQTKPEMINLISLSAQDLDITDQEVVEQVLRLHKPDIVINAATYTAVDKAEEDIKTAYAVNDLGSEYLALSCKDLNSKLIHVSTDFVFDGTKTTPYQTDEKPNPINVYGASKLAGDIKVNDILGAQATIIRTAWVYSANGNNFVKTMLRLMTEKEHLGIVYDQVGTPTWAKGLAKMIWALIMPEGLNAGNLDVQSSSPQALTPSSSEALLLHWTDAGVCSWYDFAVAIQELAVEKGFLDKAIPVRPIPASAYPTPATRPSFSVIDKASAEQASGVETIHWRKQLSEMMDELKHSQNNK